MLRRIIAPLTLSVGLVVGCSAPATPTPAPAAKSAAPAAAPAPAQKAAPAASGGGGAAKVSMQVSGAKTFDGQLAQATCRANPPLGKDGPSVEVEARGGDNAVSFALIDPKPGTFPIAALNLDYDKPTRAENVTFEVGGTRYVEGRGEITVTDPSGKKGSLTAQRFIQQGTASTIEVTLKAQWECP